MQMSNYTGWIASEGETIFVEVTDIEKAAGSHCTVLLESGPAQLWLHNQTAESLERLGLQLLDAAARQQRHVVESKITALDAATITLNEAEPMPF